MPSRTRVETEALGHEVLEALKRAEQDCGPDRWVRKSRLCALFNTLRQQRGVEPLEAKQLASPLNRLARIGLVERDAAAHKGCVRRAEGVPETQQSTLCPVAATCDSEPPPAPELQRVLDKHVCRTDEDSAVREPDDTVLAEPRTLFDYDVDHVQASGEGIVTLLTASRYLVPVSGYKRAALVNYFADLVDVSCTALDELAEDRALVKVREVTDKAKEYFGETESDLDEISSSINAFCDDYLLAHTDQHGNPALPSVDSNQRATVKATEVDDAWLDELRKMLERLSELAHNRSIVLSEAKFGLD